jgi:hypothetical protein
MGLFDYVLVQFPLPKTAPAWIDDTTEWQTKDTVDTQYMETFVITKEGRLIHKTVEYESVPEEERPYYGTPEWETSPFAKFCGIIRSIPTGDVDTNFHGDLHIGATSKKAPYEFYDCVCRFTNGNLEWIKEDNRKNN